MLHTVNIVCKILDGAVVSGTQTLNERMILFMHTLTGVDVRATTEAMKIHAVYREIGNSELQVLYTMHTNWHGRRWHKHVIAAEEEANSCREMMHDMQHMEYFIDHKNRWQEEQSSREMHQLFITREGEEADKTARLLNVYESDTEDEDCDTETAYPRPCMDLMKTLPDEKGVSLHSQPVSFPGSALTKYKYCKHGRQKSICKTCGGSGLCEHSRQKSKCKDCGRGYCKHGRQKSHCKDCGTGQCEHNLRKARCKDCGTKYCQHGRSVSRCKDCKM
jgi:hypothetical protein